RAARDGIVLLARQNLVEPDRALRERDGGARQVKKPGPVRAPAGQGPSLVGPLAQPLDPVATGPRVVKAQTLDVHDLEARALDLGQGLAEPGEVAVREDVPVEELGLAGRLPVELVDDAVVEIEAAVLQHPAHVAEERWIVRDPDVLDHTDRRDLVESG